VAVRLKGNYLVLSRAREYHLIFEDDFHNAIGVCLVRYSGDRKLAGRMLLEGDLGLGFGSSDCEVLNFVLIEHIINTHDGQHLVLIKRPAVLTGRNRENSLHVCCNITEDVGSSLDL